MLTGGELDPITLGLSIFTGCLLLFVLALSYSSLLVSLFPERVRTNEVYNITTDDLWRLRLCRYRRDRSRGEPILLVHGLNGNQHSFINPPGKSLVEHLVAKGYDCWTLDLRGCRSSVAPFERNITDATIDDQLMQDLPAAIRHILKTTGYEKVHYIGHSLGGMLLYAYALQFGSKHIASGVTLAAPLGFEGTEVRRSNGLVFLLGLFPSVWGNVARGVVPFAMGMNTSLGAFPINMKNLMIGVNTSVVHNLLEDPLPKVMHQFVYWVNMKTWRMNAGQLDVKDGLASLDFPLMALYAQVDPFIPLPKAREFVSALPHEDKEIVICSKENGCEQDYGHCDILFARNGVREVYEPIARWLARHAISDKPTSERPGTPDAVIAPLKTAERAGILAGISYVEKPAVKEAAAATPAPKQAAAPVAPVSPHTEAKAPALVASVADSKLAALEAESRKAKAKDEEKPVSSQRIRTAAASLESLARQFRDVDATTPSTTVSAPLKKKTAASPAPPKKSSAKSPVKKATAAPAKPEAKAKPAVAKAAAKPPAEAPAKKAAAKKPAAKSAAVKKPVAKKAPAKKAAVKKKA
ncbi:MAG: alpha/beta fold hydrolase [Candidatus Hydrogenedentes bacterium]|nr:alpha/beta fold hydrolase [Candidatus Hydrogenedentota bacterium]